MKREEEEEEKCLTTGKVVEMEGKQRRANRDIIGAHAIANQRMKQN